MTIKKLNAKFAVLTYSSSKQDEIDALKEIIEHAPDQTFFASFFTKSLANWVAHQIRNDESPDIFATLEFVEAHDREKIEKLQADHEAQLAAIQASYQKEIQSQNARIHNLEESLKTSDLAVETLEKRLEFAKQSGVDKLNQLKQAEDFIANVTEENSARRIENAELKNEILALKARLYDAGIVAQK